MLPFQQRRPRPAMPPTPAHQIRGSERAVLYGGYVLGIAAWFALVILVLPRVEGVRLVLLLGFVPLVLLVNVLLARRCARATSFTIEVARIEEVELHGAHMIAALLGTFLLAATMASLRPAGEAVFEHDFAVFAGLSLVFSVGGIMPFYWIPEEEPAWLLLLRHLKGIFLTFSIGLFLVAVFILLGDVM